MARLIKKYKNRRLYDTEKSQYITMDDLQQYVMDDISFTVEDATTHKDLTNVTLLQIIVEMETSTTQFLSTDVLKQVIVLAHHPMSQAFSKTINQFFTALQHPQDMTTWWRDWFKQFPH